MKTTTNPAALHHAVRLLASSPCYWRMSLADRLTAARYLAANLCLAGLF